MPDHTEDISEEDLFLYLETMDDAQADTLLVAKAAMDMRLKLQKKRTQGFGGWYKRSGMSNEELKQMLKEHVEKGDMVDVLNLAGMIHFRNAYYGKKA
jgi:hypothetical protein